jgi:hypothetical protein
MERTGFVQHQGQPILLFDFTGMRDPAQILAEIAKAREFVARQPLRKELLTLSDVTNSRYNADVMTAMKELAAHNAPYVAAGAVVTTSGIHKVAIMAVSTFSRRKLQAFGTRQEAMEWLVAQGRAASA